MLNRLAATALAVIAMSLTGAASAEALTLGSTGFPSGAAPTSCNTLGDFWVQKATIAEPSYAVPAGGGAITAWSINTTGATAGTPITFVLLRPAGGGYTVAGFDPETLPNPLPASNVATFHLATPIAASAGDVLALYSPANTVECFSIGGSIPTGDVMGAGPGSSPSVGESWTPVEEGGKLLLNVSAELIQAQDVGVTGAATPANVPAGGAAELGFAVSNAGPGAGTATFTDVVPAGLGVIAAIVDNGSCTVAGQLVSCSISGIEAGQSSPVSLLVSTPTAGVYPDTAAVTAALSDPNPANNTTSATLTVTAPALPAPPVCKVLKLTRFSLSVAQLVLPAVNCKVGKITHKASKTIRKGLVISTTPGPGASAPKGTAVNIVLSSGPPKKKHKK